ncbi:MAG: formylglycine-generating enzyme family protein [Planctomycetota bacterium]|jgi:formylglycine-generating enzyme required for sulfatase activity
MNRYLVLGLLLAVTSACSSTGHRHDETDVRSGTQREAESEPVSAQPGPIVFVNGLEYKPLGVNEQGYKEFLRTQDNAITVLVPAGHFYKRAYMDTPPDQPVDGEYLHFGDMLFDKFETSNQQVADFLNETEGLVFKDNKLFAADGQTQWAIAHKWGLKFDKNRSLVQKGYEGHPFVGGSGYLAEAYAKWVGGKLPRGMEYEKAAAGPSGLLFPWGQIDEKPDSTKCNGYLTGPQHTMPVGSYPKGVSPYGLHDMAGNVYERAYWDDGVPVDDTPATQATMIKGGSWVSPNWWNFRCVCRCGQPMEAMEGSVGFRVVVTEGLDALVDNGPKLRTLVNTYDAYEEAEARNCPIFLYLGYER